MECKSRLDEIFLPSNHRAAIIELKDKLAQSFPIEEVILFGSVARQQADDDSDIDILVITKDKLSHEAQGRMSELSFEVDMKYDTSTSLVIYDHNLWKELGRSWLYAEVARDGVVI